MEKGEEFLAYGKKYTFLENGPFADLYTIILTDGEMAKPRVVDKDWMEKGISVR